jgi:hypothetical protein
MPFGGIVEPSAEDMMSINAMARREMAAGDIYVFSAVISTEALNSYSMRMTQGSLENFVEDARAGNPLLVGHNTWELPIGKSFSAQFTDADGVQSTVVRDYMLRNYVSGSVNTDRVAEGIQGGIITDMSVGFGGVECWYKCSICSRNLWDNQCAHYPGLMYDGVRAFAWIENARLKEHSIVYSGADPGAIILKAQNMVAEGKLSANDISYLEETWKTKLSSKTISIPNRDEKPQEVTTQMNAKKLLERIKNLFSSNKTLSARLDSITLSDDDSIDIAVAKIEGVLQEAAPRLELADKLADMGITSVESAQALTDQAKLGDEYRAELVQSTLSEGVRARGDQFDKARCERMLSNLSIADIKALRDEYAAEASAKLGDPGRQTTPPDPNSQTLRTQDGKAPDSDEVVKAFMERTNRA